jgi:capsular polysaccharide biosynthesis protein
MLMSSERQDRRLRERWRYVGLLVGGLALLVVLGIQVILLIPTTYTATSAIALRPLTAEQSADSIEMQAHEFSVLLSARETTAEVLDGINVSGDHEAGVSATRDAGTSTVRIQATSTNRDVAVAVANGLAERAESVGQGDRTAKVVVVVRASPAGVTSDPPRNLYVAALLTLAALLLAAGLYQIRERTS